MLHLAAAGVGFLCLVAASLLLARGFAARGLPRWAAGSRATGAALLVGFAAVVAAPRAAAATIAFTVAVVLTWAWLAAVAAHLYRRARVDEPAQPAQPAPTAR